MPDEGENLHPILITLIFCFVAYCIGSLSSAIIVCRIAGLADPRTQGSKNPGATNVLRIGGKKAAIATLLGDVIKGIIPVLIIKQINPLPDVIGPVMIAVFLGHLYPLFFKFQGGKGVATAIGAILGLYWPVGLFLIGTWGLAAYLFRISSLAALIAALLAPFFVFWWLSGEYAMYVAVISMMLFWRHRSNIQRLWDGKEPKIGEK